MIRKGSLIPLSIFLLTGCTDTMDSLTREFRNANNEGIDAMMMVVDDESAHRMNLRVFKPLNERYKDIERRMDIWKNNRATNKELIESTFKSDSFYLYYAEIEVNKERFSMERMRLRNLYKQYQDRELQKMRDAGDPDPVITDPAKACPKLHELIMQDKLKPIEQQLMQPKLTQLVQSFPSLKCENYEGLHKIFEARMEKFAPKASRGSLVW